MNPPNNLAQRIEAFKSNMQLLFHNKYTGKEGILLADIIPMYYRYFNLPLTPRDIVREDRQNELTNNFDWVGALSICDSLRPFFKMNRERTHLLIKKEANRPECEMKEIAKLTNFNVLNASTYQQLLNLVSVKFRNLPMDEKLAFKRDILHNLDINLESENQNNGLMPEEGHFINAVPHFPPPPSIIEGAFNSLNGISSGNLLDVLIGVGNCNSLEGVPGDMQALTHASPGQGNSRKRKISHESATDFHNSGINGADSSKKSKPFSPDPSALIQSSVPAAVNGNILLDLQLDASHTSPVNDDDNVDVEKSTIIPQENGMVAISESEVHTSTNKTDSVENQNGNTSPSLPHSPNHFQTHSRLTCDVDKKICNDMAILKEFSKESDGRLNPNDWVIFLVSKDELGYYKGREKLNCQAKSYCVESKTWKLHSNQNRKLRLPNKMVVFGEFGIENEVTYFEIIDCLKCEEDLLNIPFKQRYKKAEEMIFRLANCTVGGIPVRMKPYLTMENLSGLARFENAAETALFINTNIFAFTNPRTLKLNNQVSLENLLRQDVFVSTGVIPMDSVVNIAESGPENIVDVEIPPETNEINPAPLNHNGSNTNHNNENVASLRPSKEEPVVRNDTDIPLSHHTNNPLDIQVYAEYYANAFKDLVPPKQNTNFQRASVPHPQKHCTIACVDVEDVRLNHTILTNPFSFCKSFGWKRIVNGRIVKYLSPCGKIFDTYKQVMEFLIRTDFSYRTEPYLTIDFFTFENEIRDIVEFPVWDLQVINPNISEGLEKVPITCVNEIDKEVLPGFTYITRSSTGNNIDIPLFDIGNECICTNECQSNCCSCVTDTTKRHTKGFVHSVCRGKYKGYDFRRLYRTVPRGIYECNYKCKCSANNGVYCGNRVAQAPIKWKLQVFRKADGWGLRTLHDIPKGHFVCQFIGKIVLEEEAVNGEHRYQVKLGPVYDCPYKNCKHQLGDETLNKNCRTPLRKTRGRHACLNTYENQNLYLDATHEGNVGRFINHAPKSNVFMQTVFIEEKPECLPHIAFFAKENILAGKELTSNFSTVRNGINENATEKETESFSQRPGPKKATGKGVQELRNNDSQQGSQSQVSDRQENGPNDNDQLNPANLCSVDNDDVLSQGSSRSSTTSYRNSSSLPVVRLEKINIDHTLRQHKLRSQSRTPTETNDENTEHPNIALAQIKAEPVDTTNIKQEIVKVEVWSLKIERIEETENPLPHLIPEESQILGDLNLDDDSEMVANDPESIVSNSSETAVDNPETRVSVSETAVGNSETGVSDSETSFSSPKARVHSSETALSFSEIMAENPVKYPREDIVIDLTEDSNDKLDSQEQILDLSKIKVNEQEVLISHPDRNVSRRENDQESSVLPLDFSRTGRDTSTQNSPHRSRPRSRKLTSTQRKLNNSLSQPQPSTSRKSLGSTSTYHFPSVHSVKDCMEICCIYNESGFPQHVANNKLFRCRIFGFERKVKDGSVFYDTPCGRMFVDEQSIFKFLLEAAHLDLAVDNFCFNPQVECSPNIWMKEQCFDLNPNTYTLTEDITNGQELIPVKCKTFENGMELPNFRYISKYEYSEQYKRESLFLPENCCCDCVNGCVDPHECICLKRTTFRNELQSSQSSAEKLKVSHGYQLRRLPKPDDQGIFECGSLCNCVKNCSNRVAQNNMAWSLEVFQTENTGWGVRTLQDIPQGAFVCNFVGLVKLVHESNSGDRQYQVNVTLPNGHIQTKPTGPIYRDNKYIIDATREGNLARFFNHSCNPNMFPQTVFVPHPFMKVAPYISFFANQDIIATTELTFNYTGILEDKTNKMMACFCGASDCKEKFL